MAIMHPGELAVNVSPIDVHTDPDPTECEPVVILGPNARGGEPGKVPPGKFDDWRTLDARRMAHCLRAAGLWVTVIYPKGYQAEPGGKVEDGKRPIGAGWGRDRATTSLINGRFDRHPKAGVGACLGPGKGPGGEWLSDFECDGPEGLGSLETLLGGEVPETVGWSSSRGPHRLFLIDQERIAPILARLGKFTARAGLEKGVYKFSSLPGLELRLGGEGKQIQSAVPPTVGTSGEPRAWNDADAIAWAPDAFYNTLEAIARQADDDARKATPPPRAKRPTRPKADGPTPESRARAYVFSDKFPESIEGNRGHDQLFYAACCLVDGFGLTYDQALPIFRDWNEQKAHPPEHEGQVEHKLRDAIDLHPHPSLRLLNAERNGAGPRARASSNGHHSGNGSMPSDEPDAGAAAPEVFRNYEVVQADDDGEKFEREPIDQPDLIRRLAELTDGGPQMAGAALFAHDGGDAEPIQFNGPDQLFAWLGQRFPIDWQGGGAYVSERRLFEGLKLSVRRHDSIERRPHFPKVPGVYYACSWPDELGDGSALDGLLDLFSPATKHDRELIRSFVYTLFWGGEPGKRPLFVAEGPEGDPMGGRGVGKTELFSYLAELVGGALANVSARDDITAVTKRIINDRARKRCVLLDNVKAERFSWGDLEGLITGPTVGGWLNYIGDESRPNLATYCITINGASLSEDLAQRTVMIRLNRPASYDRDGQAWSDFTMNYIRENRARIVADVAAAFARSAAPIKSHQRWASWTHAVLARCAKPFALQNLIIRRQDDINDDRAASNDFGRFLARRIESKTGAEDAANVVIWISTSAMVPMVREFSEERVTLLNASKKINRFRPSELTKLDRPDGKGWKWSGRNTDPKAKPTEEWIFPYDGSVNI